VGFVGILILLINTAWGILKPYKENCSESLFTHSQLRMCGKSLIFVPHGRAILQSCCIWHWNDGLSSL